jgi:hypothetical protein
MPAHGGAFVNRNALFTLGGTSFANQVWKVRLVPDTPFQQQRTMVPDGTISDVDSATWTMELEGLQDYETGGLAAYLQTNAGVAVAFQYAPVNTAGKKKFTGTVTVIAPPAGGEQGEFAQMELEMPITGQPTITTV